MKRLWIALFVALSLITAACGSSDNEDSADDGGSDVSTDASSEESTDTSDQEDAESDEQSDEQPADAGEAVTLRWRTRPDNQAEADVYQAISDDIAAASAGLELEYEPGGSDSSAYQDVLKTELASGTAPDVFWIPGTDVADFVTRGLILDVRDLADASGHDDSDFYDGPMFHLSFDPESSSAGDVLWGLPRDVSAFAIYLNLDLISEAGAEDPRDLAAAGEWNWTTFSEVAADVTALGAENRGFGSDAWWGPYGYFVNAAGGSFFNEDRTACAFDSQESLAGLEFANELFTSGNTINWGESAAEPYLAGSLGMFMNGRWATPSARELAAFNWDVVKLPDGPGGPTNWLFWGAYVVNADTEHPEAAWDLILELTSADAQTRVSELGANIPSRKGQDLIDAFVGFGPPDNGQAFIDGITEAPVAEGPLWGGSWPDFSNAIGPRVNAVIAGDETIDSFADTACTEANTAAFG